MRFKILLWLLGFVMEQASKNNARFQRKIKTQKFTLQIGCADGYARHFVIQDQKVMSYPGKASEPIYLGPGHEPAFTITFDSAATGFKTLSAKDKQLAMISGLQDKRIKIDGNPLYLMWFQSLGKLLEQ